MNTNAIETANTGQTGTENQSVFTPFIQKAIRFATKTHEVYQKQRRKGQDIPYIVHPLTVALILANSGAPEDVIAAGILHDTIEDSIDRKKVTYEMLQTRFGTTVADIVEGVTEKDKTLPWIERKREALDHIRTMEAPTLWVKSADTISNTTDLLTDYRDRKDEAFAHFHASKEDYIANSQAVIRALLDRWSEVSLGWGENPLVTDLNILARDMAEFTK